MAGADAKRQKATQDRVEKIVNMVEDDTFKRWEYAGAKASQTPEEAALAQAQRFMAAQSFLLSWQLGKVPTGWHRPRRLADFENESPEVLAAAKLVARRRMEERTRDATDRINEIRTAAGNRAAAPPPAPRPISKKEIEDLKNAYSKFSYDLYDINTALSNASSTIAELVLRTEALVEHRSRTSAS